MTPSVGKHRADLDRCKHPSDQPRPEGAHVLKEFRQFVLRGNVVDLAIAVVIGAAFGAVVTSMVEDLITPLVAAIGGKSDFSDLTLGIRDSEIRYGEFLTALLSFLVVSAVVFFFVVKPLNALLARLRPEPAVDQPTRACPECLSDIPAPARRCAFCTAEVAPQAA